MKSPSSQTEPLQLNVHVNYWKDQPEYSIVEFFHFGREEGKEDRQVQNFSLDSV